MPQFGKLLLRFTDPKKPPERAKVFELIQMELRLPLTGLRAVGSGYNAFTETEADIDNLLTTAARLKLLTIGLEAKLPPKVKANRSIICRQVDEFVGRHTKEEIQAEIQRCNSNLKVAEVHKFGPHTHVFKVEFFTMEMARTVLERGLLLFHMRISPSQIKQEEYEDVLMCFNCYKLEAHTTRDCPNPDTVVCSECSGHHSFRNCTSDFKKCINCGGAHRTMAMSCPEKKAVIRKKRENKEEIIKSKEENTYARILAKTVHDAQQNRPGPDNIQTMQNTGIRAYIMLLDAHMQNMIKPGTYNSRLNETLKNNNIEPIKLPDNPNSNELFSNDNIGSTLMSLIDIEKTVNSMQEQLQAKKTRTDGKRKLLSSEEIEEMDIFGEKGMDEEVGGGTCILDKHIEREFENTREAEDLDLEIIVQDQANRKDLNGKELKKLHSENKLKYVIQAGSIYSQESIDRLIFQEKVKEDRENIRLVDNLEFKRIKNGTLKMAIKPQGKKSKKDDEC